MFNFFISKPSNTNHPIKKYSRFDYIRRKYEFEINKITNYYNNRIRGVNNKNIFSKLIYLLQPNLDLDIISYYKSVDQSSPYLARQFKFVSNISKGGIYRNLFYFDNSYSVVCSTNTDIDLFKVNLEWKKLTPLRLIYTTESTLDFYQMDKTLATKNNNITIVELDINQMLLQYKFWAKEQLKYDFSTNPNVYVYQYLYPGLMKTSIDHILFNRLYNLYYGYIIPTSNIKHPFVLIDYTKGIDDIYNNILSDLENTSSDLERILLTIPTLVYPNMLSALYINRPIYNRQSEWSIWLSRLKYICFFIDFLGKRGIARNRDIIYDLPTEIKRLENRSTDLFNILPNDLSSELLFYIDKIKSKVGRR